MAVELVLVIAALVAAAVAVAIAVQLRARGARIEAALDRAEERQQRGAADLERRQAETQRALYETMQGGFDRAQRQLADHLTRNTEDLVKRMESLTRSTDERLRHISGQVDQRLLEGFEKTSKTFSDIRERLTLIDKAQEKIGQLSTQIVSLEQVLADRTSRGAFGEVQLEALVANVLPPSGFRMQHTLSNGNRVDCMLFLPPPNGPVPIDSKFPLENFQRMVDRQTPPETRATARRDFARDVQTHIDAVAVKYIIPGETAEGAILFVPSEAVFAEIHSSHPELVGRAQRARVWLASPTTLMAILTTAAAVLKDSETRKQVHAIQEHLRYLADDFGRFQKRMDALARHVDQAHRDVQDVHKSAQKITGRFGRIERLELGGE